MALLEHILQWRNGLNKRSWKAEQLNIEVPLSEWMLGAAVQFKIKVKLHSKKNDALLAEVPP